MKVAHVLRKYNPGEWGGTETALLGLCEGLNRLGVKSVAYCPSIPSTPDRDPLTEVGCELRRFRACLPIWGISAEKRRQMVAVGGNLMSFGLIRALWKEPGLTVIHSHTAGRIGAIARMVAQKRGLPFLLTIHGGVYDRQMASIGPFDASTNQGWEWGRLCGLLLRTHRLLTDADAVITCNEREAALISKFHPSQRVVTQPHCVRLKDYQVDQREAAREAFPRIQGRSLLLALGRVDPVKNQAWLIEQMPELVRRYPDLLLVLVGAPTDRVYMDVIGRRLIQLHLEGNVLLAGGLPPSDPRLIGLLQRARALVLPSLAETFGLVILEGWAAGTPVVSTRTSGARSLIEIGKTGFLFDLTNPAEFHRCLEDAWSNRLLTSKMASAGRERVSADFDSRIVAERMKRIYDDLIEEKYALRHPTRR